MKAVIRIGKVECKFEVPEQEIKDAPMRVLELAEFNQTEYLNFMREAKKLALSLYRETKKNANL